MVVLAFVHTLEVVMDAVDSTWSLVKFSPSDVHRVWRFLQDVPAEENGFLHPEAGVGLDEFLGRVAPQWEAEARGEDLAAGHVPQTNFFLWENYDSPAKKVVARLKLRHELTDTLERNGGHVGYFVHRDYRGRGVGVTALRLLLPIAAQLVAEDELLATMDPDNVASQRMFAACGGEYIDRDGERVRMRIDLRPWQRDREVR
ncbi:hypothetical protein C1Y63_04590 [Corynebacterium sp. 13CS0277]|nr:hypothetical protein C1Y63_04590 [Corynebacterium sp. 13CS0277]